MTNKESTSINGSLWLLITIILAGAFLRLWYAYPNPLNGDEVGVGVLQASGQAATLSARLPLTIVPIDEAKQLIEYSPEFGVSEVLHSLRTAGMHPPLYYIGLHLLLESGLNQTFQLRSVSIFFSCLSIWALFYIGRFMFSPMVGLLSATFLACSLYGVIFGSMVRPYPLAMLISLAWISLVLHLEQSKPWKLISLNIAALILFPAAGLYTIYQFGFVALLGFTFLIIRNYRDFNACRVLGISMGAVFCLFLPWVPALIDQIYVLRGNTYYFHLDSASVSLASLLDILAEFNLLIPRMMLGAPWDLLSTYLLSGIVGLGVLFSLRGSISRSFTLATLLHLGVYIAVERTLNMNTLITHKFLFFLMPIYLMYFSVGLQTLVRTRAAQALIIAIFMLSPVLICVNRPVISPYESYIQEFSNVIDSSTTDSAPVLLVLHSTERRFVFPLIHAISGQIDVLIAPSLASWEDLLVQIPDNRYEAVFWAKICEGLAPCTTLSNLDLIRTRDQFSSKGLALKRVLASGWEPMIHELFIARKADTPGN